MPAWNGGNHSRSDQRALQWMGCTGARAHPLPTKGNRTLSGDECVDEGGPTRDELFAQYNYPSGHNPDQHARLLTELKRMQYTTDGEGCRLLETLPWGSYRGTALPLKSAKTSLEAADANQFYPDQDYKIMRAGMVLGSDFPFDKATKDPTSQFEVIAKIELIMERILQFLPHTSRAALSQVSATVCFAVSQHNKIWSITDQNLLNAEFSVKEFESIVAAGQQNGEQEPRGARFLTVATHLGEYNHWIGLRSRGSFQDMGFGVLRLLRAVTEWGPTIRRLCIKHVPLIDHKVAAGLVEACPNLSRFELIGCGQLSYFGIVKLLGYLQDVQARRGCWIHFDPCPSFYKGPRCARTVPSIGHSPETLLMGGPYTHTDDHGRQFDRKGMYGVTLNEPGVDLPTAILKIILYDLGPAAKAAGQLHILTDLSSMCRQSLEALPLPKESVPLMLRALEIKEEMGELVAPFQHAWNDAHADVTPVPPFHRRHWPLKLQKQASELRHALWWLGVRACYGDAGWRQTRDRGFYSCDWRLKKPDFMEWTLECICSVCNLSIPRLFFNAGQVCEGCRLENRIHAENDHLEPEVRKATRALGFGPDDKDYVTNAQSNFPFDAFEPSSEGVHPVQTREDFIRLTKNADSLKPFFKYLARLDREENKVHFPRARMQARQRDHWASETPDLHATQETILFQHPYRRTLTHEEYAVNDGNGFTPQQGASTIQW